MKYIIEVVEYETEKVVREIGPYSDERMANRADDGLTRQINHDRYFTRIVERAS